MRKNILIFLPIITLLIYFFYPKESIKGGICPTCYITECDCIGYEVREDAYGPVKSTCYGLIHSCVKKESMR